MEMFKMYQAPYDTQGFPFLNFYIRLSAGGIAPYLPTEIQNKYRNHFVGDVFKKIFDRIGTQDPLIKVAPNPFAYPTVPREMYKYTKGRAKKCLCDEEYYHTHIIKTMLANHYPTFNLANEEEESIFDTLIQNTDCNKIFAENWIYQEKLSDILNSVADGYKDPKTGMKYDGPFKNSPFKDQVAKYLREKFLTIIKDLDDKEYLNTGFLGMGVALNARYDDKRIEQLIKEITPPQKAGVSLTNEVALKEYLKGTKLYKELMATNRYVSTIVAMNQLMGKSSLERTNLYLTEDGPMARAAQAVVNCRNKKIDITTHKRFMENIADITIKAGETPYTELMSSEDESKLIATCNILTKYNG